MALTFAKVMSYANLLSDPQIKQSFDKLVIFSKVYNSENRQQFIDFLIKYSQTEDGKVILENFNKSLDHIATAYTKGDG